LEKQQEEEQPNIKAPILVESWKISSNGNIFHYFKLFETGIIFQLYIKFNLLQSRNNI
jgi:hypothetical protein